MAIESRLKTCKIESTPWLVKGVVDETTFARLAEDAEDKRVEAVVDLSLARETRDEIRIVGSVSAVVQMICQRCLQPYKCEIGVKIDEVFTEKAQIEDMRFIDEPEISQDSEQSDYFDKDSHFKLLHYIEDEILLAVPPYPVHIDAKQCDKGMIVRLQEKAEEESVKSNPFSILKNLK